MKGCVRIERRSLCDSGLRSPERPVDEEAHADWLESQLDAADAVGEANYLAQHLHEDD